MQENRSDLLLNKRQINLLFLFCAIIALVITAGGTWSWLLLDLYDYIIHGEFYYDCMTFYLPTFSKESFGECKSTDIVGLMIQFAITTGLITGLFKMIIQTRRVALAK